MTFGDRMTAAQKAVREKLAYQKMTWGDPKPQPRYIAEDVVEGRTVAEWAARVDANTEAADDLYRVSRTLVVVDIGASGIPSKAVDAVRRWRDAGSPTEYTDTAKRIEALKAEAEKHAALATLQEDQACKAVAAAAEAESANASAKEIKEHKKKVEQHRRYAKTQRDKADRLFAQAEKLVARWKEEHP